MPLKRLDRDKAFLMVCDIQNNFAQDTYCYEGVMATAEAMIQAAQLLKIPILITEHRKKTESHTMPCLMKLLNGNKHQPLIKEKFSMLVPQIQEILHKTPERRQIILVGMESHICVLQTCLDLIQKGYDVWVVTDGVTSLSAFERTIGLKRMEKAGGELTSLQTIVFELLKYSSDQYFHELCEVMKNLEKKSTLTHL